MSYAASLLATYPSSYGPANLLSDDLVQRTAYDDLFPPSVPYMSSGRLLSDDLAFNNQINYDSTTYHPSLYPHPNPTSVYPTTKHPKPVATNQPKTVPPNNSYASLNDISEYSDSLATASNTNTASSVARSVNGPTNMFSNYNRLPSNDDDNPQRASIWSPPKTKQKGQSNEIKVKSTTRTQPPIGVHKKSSTDELDNDVTPVPSPQPPISLTKPPNHLQRNATITETIRQSPSIDIQTWVNDTEKVSAIDEQAAEQAWSMKIDQLHHVQAQREKDKAKSSRALPLPPKKVDSKPTTTKTKSIADTKSRDTTTQANGDTYFDSLFDGDYFRKPPSNDYSVNTSSHQPTTKKNKPTTNLFNNSNVAKNPKPVPQRKAPRYEPPTPKRPPLLLPPPPPPITTTTWRKPHNFDPLYPTYSYNELTPREYEHKDTDERFREALQKVRADRAEQQQREINETTAKRLNYGDYVRHSTKDALLQNAVKPSPWSDFMHLKKGNVYSLSREEKKQLYNQSKSYGERVRYRNFAIQHASETARSHRHSVPLLDEVQESESNNATPRQPVSKSVSRTSRRPDSASTNKSHIKQTGIHGGNRIGPNQTSRTSIRHDRSNNGRPSDDERGNASDYETNRKSRQKSNQKNVHYAKFDSSGRTINKSEANQNELDNRSQRNIRMKKS